MKNRSTITILILAAALVLMCRSGLAKEPNPLQGAFVPEQITGKVGATVTLVLTIEPLREFSGVKLTVKVPPGLQLVRGPATSTIKDVKTDKKYEVTYVLRVKTPGEQELWVHAEAQGLSPTEYISQSYLAVVNPEKKPPDYNIEEDANGRKIRVYEVP